MAKYFTEEENKKWRESLPKKIVCVKLIVRSNKGNILLVKPDYKPTWQLPGGGVDEGESPEEAALRELKEETGVQGDARHLRIVGTIFKKSDEQLFLLYEYGEILDEDESLQPEDTEIEKYEFVSQAAVAERLPEYYAAFWQQYRAL